MASVDAALTSEQGVTFVAVSVKDHVIDNPTLANDAIDEFALRFSCQLVVLVGSRNRRLRGNRRDIVDFVARNLHRLPWKRYQMAA